MTLAPSGARGKYLALWIVSRNLGQLVGGAIKSVTHLGNEQMHDLRIVSNLDSRSLSKNHVKGADGGVTPDTYLAFVIIECIA